MKVFPNFDIAIKQARSDLKKSGFDVSPQYWQGVDVSSKPEMRTRELKNWDFSVQLSPGFLTDLEPLRRDVKPNLPWVDKHFEEERMSGSPINPGETWKIWPYGHSADKFRNQYGQYNHSYAERYWPKFAGMEAGGHVPSGLLLEPRRGIRYDYADVEDLITLLKRDPLTRQAYMPVWFPEDGSHFDRKPCSLGYHFLMRRDRFDINYYMRSCDIIRHFQDDIYLTVRLLISILNVLRATNVTPWNEVVPGTFTMYITSLHCFANDIRTL